MIKSSTIIFILILLIFSTSILYCGLSDNPRQRAFDYYRSSLYDEALPLLKELVQNDSSADYYNDYLMLADIYVRKGLKDSAQYVIKLGRIRTKKNPDMRVVKRNTEIWDNLEKQLKYQRSKLDIPKFKPLSLYEEKKDTVKADTSVIRDSLLTASGSEVSGDSMTISTDTTLTVNQSDSTGKKPRLSGATPHDLTPNLPGFNNPGAPTIAGGSRAVEDFIKSNNLFPEKAREAGLTQGAAVVDVKVDSLGNAVEFNVFREHPEDMGFGDMAVMILQAMKYEPAVIDSQRVEGILRQPVMFLPEPGSE
ncbi:MAG: energy transducer TonB [FCB group bacterium]|nr:energy transducer TonB [FCB group bacterium]